MSRKSAHASLRLLPPPRGSASLPDLAHVYEDPLRRPGELHEIYPVTGRVLSTLKGSALQAAMPTGTAARLLIEAELVRADLNAIGRRDAQRRLDEAAVGGRVSRRLSAAEADYVRGLRRPPGYVPTLVTLPVRLI